MKKLSRKRQLAPYYKLFSLLRLFRSISLADKPFGFRSEQYSMPAAECTTHRWRERAESIYTNAHNEQTEKQLQAIQ